MVASIKEFKFFIEELQWLDPLKRHSYGRPNFSGALSSVGRATDF
ncbi:uncharacterized protein METZ01_LOCUS480423 [marine metagenome]|uniref:Uncharacterized protein n=1 Tax=marine metagenome TaxID=408172 RepID=A0A383C686_9ZZZZ